MTLLGADREKYPQVETNCGGYQCQAQIFEFKASKSLAIPLECHYQNEPMFVENSEALFILNAGNESLAYIETE